MASYATVTELRESTDIEATDALTLRVLESWLNAASEAIDLAMNRFDGFLAAAAATVRYFSGEGTNDLTIDECVEITQVAVKSSTAVTTYTAWTTPTTPMTGDGDWMPMPLRTREKDWPYRYIKVDPNGSYTIFTDGDGLPTVAVTAKWGFATTAPLIVKQACIAQAARWYKIAQAGMSDVVGSPETGELIYRRARLDLDIERMLTNQRLKVPVI